MCFKIARKFSLVGFLLWFSLLGISDLQAQEQEPIQWSSQAPIPDYEALSEGPPFIIADRNLTVHAFNSQPLDLTENDSPRAVFYRQWAQERGWSEPVDIILNPDGNNLNLLAVYLDDQEIVHLLIQMNFNLLYYAKANLAEAALAPAWSMPALLDDQSTALTLGLPFLAAMSGDGLENLVVIYSGFRDGNGIYALQSNDNGRSWSNAVPIYLSGNEAVLPVAPQLYYGQSNRMHAVLSTFNGDGSGGPGYYTQLDVSNGRWRGLVDLDQPGIRTPNVIEYEDDIIVTYYQNDENINWWRKSSDGGKTWSRPAPISSLHRGTNGFTAFAIDSSNNLHLFFAQRMDENNHGVWHTLWNGNGWAEIAPVVRGPQVRDEVGGRGFDPNSVRAAILNGNLLFVTWATDGFAGLNGAWYVYAPLDTPQLELVSLATQTPVATLDEAGETITQASEMLTPTPTFPPGLQIESDTTSDNPAFPLIVGLVPVIALIIGVVIVHQIYYRPRS